MVTYRFSTAKMISETMKYQFSPSLNVQHLNELYQDDIKHAVEMFEMYLDIMPNSLSELRNLCNEKSYVDLAAALHKMKSCCGLVGLSHLEISAKYLEQKCIDCSNGIPMNCQIFANALSMFINISERANLQIENEIKQMKLFLGE
jgi:HPt (histidine-containing phosphotransfer) domain-containing protein